MNIATLKPPSGWKVLNEEQKHAFLSEEGEDDGIRKILAIAQPLDRLNGDVFAKLEYQSIGYIENPNSSIDCAYVTKKIKEDVEIINSENNLDVNSCIQLGRLRPVPTFDMARKTLSYGIEMYFGSEVAINLYRVWLVRNGIVALTLVGTPNDKLSLQDWSVLIEPSLRYERYQAGRDKRAKGNLENVILMLHFT